MTTAGRSYSHRTATEGSTVVIKLPALTLSVGGACSLVALGIIIGLAVTGQMAPLFGGLLALLALSNILRREA